MKNTYRPQHRKNKGAIFASILLLLTLIAVFSLGALAVDLAQRVNAQSELQAAVDAAALAGAQALVNNPGSTQTAKNYATTVAAANKSGGLSVSNNTPGVIVTVNVQ